ncbi:hypothetical protein D3C73_08120 [compost metagenome]
MAEAHLRAALKAGITEAEFWLLTPYRLSMRLQSLGRAQLEASLYSGWFGERFAREERLQGPASYIKSMLDAPDLKEAEAMAEAMFHRMATDWGLEVKPLSEVP